MDLRQLRTFVAVAEELHFTRAAARLGIAQPAVSQQIRALERELGLVLLDRSSRRVTLTRAGETLRARAVRMLDELRAAQADLDALKGLRAGRVAVGVTPTPGAFQVAATIGRFHRRFPAIEISLREGLSRDLAEDLRAGTLDVAFVTLTEDAVGPKLRRLVLTSEPLVAVLPNGHPLARRGRVRLDDLQREPFIGFPPGATIRADVDEAAGRAGWTPLTRFEVTQASRMRELVTNGVGVAILPAGDVPATADLQALPLVDRGLTHQVAATWRSGEALDPAARALVDVAAATA